MDEQEAHAVLAMAREVETHAADPDAAEWQARLAPQALVDAVSTLVDAKRVDEALDLVGCLSVYWQDLGKILDGIELCQSVLQAAGSTRSRASARARLVLGELAFRTGDQATAATASVLAREVADEVGDLWVGARAELNLSRVAFRDGDAARIFQHSSEVLERAGDNGRLRAGGQHMVGWAHYTAGNVSAALDAFEANANAYRSMGHPVNEASERANVADVAMESGDLERAATNLAAAFGIPAATASRYLMPSLIRSAGALASLRGDHERAVRLFAGAEELYRRHGFEADPGDEFTPPLEAASREAIGAAALAAIVEASSSTPDDNLIAIARASIII